MRERPPPAPSRMTNGFAPAGGCVVLVTTISPTPTPVAKAMVNGVMGKKCATSIPDSAVRKWPKTTFLGWASGASGSANKMTQEAPKGAMTTAYRVTSVR